MFSAGRVFIRKLIRVLVATSWGLGVPLVSQAQLVAPASPASAPAASDSMERAQRQADNVLRWIKVHADKPKAAPANPPPAPIPVAARPPARNTSTANAAAAAAAAAAASVATPAAEAEPPPVAQDAPPAYATAPAVPAPAPVQAAPQPPPPVPAAAVEPEIVLVAISQAQPELSKKIVETMNNDRVNVRFTVLPNGTVTNADIVQSSNRRLNKPTLDAVSTWRFQPIRANHTVTVELAFKD
ncbi:MAG: hypothetical protein CFE43_06700 [Burkholderiales bacterium PBB3]|nr:MAG: hypothetical protein CFE43_06700 [Burkholderiales bacterium PBB3]